MTHAKQASKRSNTGVHAITLGEEEIADVSLATFQVFDKENPGTSRLVRLPSRAYGRCGCHACHGGCHQSA
jgi:hypothetical protein